MKPQTPAYPIRTASIRTGLIAVLAVVAALAGCATGPTGEVAQTQAANRILEAYDVPDLLAQAAPAVTQSLDKNLPDSSDTATRQRLRDAVFDAYAPKALEADVSRRLRGNAEAADKQEALAAAADQLDSPLAQRMIGLEATTGNDNFARNFNTFIDQPAGDGRKSRLRVIDSLSDDMQIVQLQTGFNVTLLEAMIRSRNAAVDSANQVDEQQIDRMLSNTREGIRSKLDQRVPLMLLYVYRDVDDATLAQYAELQSQPDMIWTNQAVEDAIIGALSAAGKKVPARFNASSSSS